MWLLWLLFSRFLRDFSAVSSFFTSTRLIGTLGEVMSVRNGTSGARAVSGGSARAIARGSSRAPARWLHVQGVLVGCVVR